MMLNVLILVLFPLAMAFAASSDLLTMTISNRLVLALTGSFFVLAIFAGLGWAEIGSHILAAAVVLAGAFICFARGWIGGGDAKIAAAIALWFGFDQVMPYLLYASLLGGALTLLILKFRTGPLPASLSSYSWIQRLHDNNSGVPYGIALAAAALMIYPDTIFMQKIVM
ncbi:MAG: prepilin peptidase [Rhizobiales bacterium]|nr:prepilin peptidase [Hyphomicrobiales bacterium]